ncbi:unnamed protein product [Arabidopsis lyrata]|uniref:Predicted protein n=1 Tax=Arabidopsis lyrata subsp. lyrata TaxID=81972 RepID=D7LL33_ARALL|nr:predicted protein [Arabidopsis lyrata subsp. lyrata]CAH8263522.1 unnamed protein product [Arabidopsis lyrata]
MSSRINQYKISVSLSGTIIETSPITMFSDAGRANARRRRDIQSSSRKLRTTFFFLWFLVRPLISVTSCSHPLLPLSFDVTELLERGQWCLPANHHHISSRSTPRVSKLAKGEAYASIRMRILQVSEDDGWDIAGFCDSESEISRRD